MPSEQATYVQKYMSIHVSNKDIKEKILLSNPLPDNIKISQLLDEYIKELLVENKKHNTLNQEKVSRPSGHNFSTIIKTMECYGSRAR